ncbi:hypothetical protein ACFSOZ_36750 [Mesorhizobium newzealandense]|uniref:Uncharacterized protein n=1 Tax=Mesorhizobium newzealandense TaxID=1300302 RepID=A0ABW4UP54_9HYPH
MNTATAEKPTFKERFNDLEPLVCDADDMLGVMAHMLELSFR